MVGQPFSLAYCR